MKRHWTLVLLACLGIFLLVGCSSTAVEVPPTPTQEPPPTEMPPTPTLEPTPTKTPIALGALKGCIYFEGELVKGQFQFWNENGNITELTTKVPSGCKTFHLAPGYYEVSASYWEGPCAHEAGCGSTVGRFPFVMESNGFLEIDFEIVLREGY